MVTKNMTGIPGEIKSHDKQPLASWKNLYFGMFIHLGLYSKLGGEWNGIPIKEGYSEQIQMWANISSVEYQQVAKEFSLENFDPEQICSLAKETGMKYIVITSKHHDGFCLFDTKTTNYNVVEATPFKKDVLKLLSDECQKQGLGFGIYFSLVDWHLGHEFDHDNNNSIPESMESIIEEQLTELMTNYGPVSEVWFDMSSPTPEQSKKFAGIVREYQPHAGINSRIWNNEGEFRTLADNQLPKKMLDNAWQTPASIYRATWGYRRWQKRDNFTDKVLDLLKSLITVRARGGNYLLNIGPHGDGSIVEFEKEVLQSIGKWINQHPTAVLGTNPTKFGEQSWGEITVSESNLYLHIFNWPESGKIHLSGLLTNVNHVVEDGSGNALEWTVRDRNIEIILPEQPTDELLTTIKVGLDGELRMIPNKTVVMGTDGCWSIPSTNIEYGYNFMDSGNYTSLEETNTRQTAYIYKQKSDEAFLEMKGKSNDNLNYLVQVSSEARVVSGKDLITTKVGPFTLASNEDIVPIHIKLAEPPHVYKDMELELDSICVSSKQDALSGNDYSIKSNK